MKKRFSLNIGLPTIVLVFIVMCLFSLSVLSLVGARADWRLTEKRVNRTSAYYASCNAAHDYLASLNSQLLQLYAQSNDDSTFLSSLSQYPDTCIFALSDLQNLEISLTFHTPDDSLICYDIISWKVIPKENIQYDEHLHVIP